MGGEAHPLEGRKQRPGRKAGAKLYVRTKHGEAFRRPGIRSIECTKAILTSAARCGTLRMFNNGGFDVRSFRRCFAFLPAAPEGRGVRMALASWVGLGSVLALICFGRGARAPRFRPAEGEELRVTRRGRRLARRAACVK